MGGSVKEEGRCALLRKTEPVKKRVSLSEMDAGKNPIQGSRLTFCTGCTGAPNFFS